MHMLLLPYVATLAFAPQRPPVPPAPDPPPSAEDEVTAEAADEDDGKFEIGGFMQRPAPSPPVQPPPPEIVETKLVWGFHRPVATWKHRGLVGSLALTGVSLLGTAVSFRARNRRFEGVSDRVEELGHERPFGGHVARAHCEENVVNRGPVTEVRDMTLAYRCASFKRMYITFRVARVASILGAISTVTFGVLHAVRRVPVRRVQARSDGFAVRF